MGTVYRGRHRVTGQPAAIKILEQHTEDDEHRLRCQREMQLAAAIAHPGIVQVFDAGEDPASGNHFLAMELLTGRPLAAYMDEPESDRTMLLRFLRLLLEPLAAAHALGITHRDLKPDNVFVLSEAKPSIKLLDFGIARQHASPRLTQAGAALGTPGYMSPEQAMGKAPTPAADVWAFGVMLYEVLTQVHPFMADTAPGVVVAACTRPHVAVREHAAHVDPSLSALVDRCLEKEPTARPQDAGTLLRELDRALGQGSLPPATVNAVVHTVDPETEADRTNAESGRGHPQGTKTPPSLVRGEQDKPRFVAAALVGFTALMGCVAVFSFLQPPWAFLAASVIFVGGAGTVAAMLRNRDAHTSTRAAGSDSTLDEAPAKGSIRPPEFGAENAPVSIVFFCDLASANSRKAFATLRKIEGLHGDKIRVSFRHAPKTTHGRQLAEGASEAFAQAGSETFWRFVARSLTSTRKQTTQRMEALFDELQLNRSSLRHALRSERHRDQVRRDQELADTLGVESAPAFLVEGKLFDGEIPAAVLADAVAGAMTPETPVCEAKTQIQHCPDFLQQSFEQILVQWTAVTTAKLSVVRSREDARQRAEQVAARAVADGADFPGLARRFGDGPTKLVGEHLPPALWGAASRLVRGEVSDVIESRIGFHILHRVT